MGNLFNDISYRLIYLKLTTFKNEKVKKLQLQVLPSGNCNIVELFVNTGISIYLWLSLRNL